MEKRYFDHCTFIKVRVRVQKRTDALGPARILLVRNWGRDPDLVGSLDYKAKPEMGMAGL